jgi:hypothetical protein
LPNPIRYAIINKRSIVIEGKLNIISLGPENMRCACFPLLSISLRALVQSVGEAVFGQYWEKMDLTTVRTEPSPIGTALTG